MTTSGPCLTCKKRRIKCDGDWPICQRCEKSKRECLRPASAPLAVVSENKYAAGINKRPRGPRIRRATAPITETQELHSKALKNYFDNHVACLPKLEPDTSASLSECILAWQETGNTSKLVELALLSLALAVYARTRSQPDAAAEAFSIYHELLKLTREHLARPNLDVVAIDACLLTIFLMGRCESAMHNTLSPDAEETLKEFKSWSHHDGAMALLRLWHLHFKGQDVSVIVKQTRRGLWKSLFLRRLPVPGWLCDGSDFGEQGLDLAFDRVRVELVNIRSDVNADKSLDDKTNRDRLRERVVKLSLDLVDIRNTLPPEFSYHQLETTHVDPTWFLSSKLRIHSSPAYANLWAHMLATRLVIASVHMTVLQYSTETSEDAEICAVLLQQIVSELAATIPQCIGIVSMDGDQLAIRSLAGLKSPLASAVVWPLSMAVSVEGYDESLHRGFRLQLERLGQIIGDGVLHAVPTDGKSLL